MSDMWNNVTVYGPASEIDRFKRLCINPSESILTAGQFGWEGCDCIISVPPARDGGSGMVVDHGHLKQVHNFQQFFAKSPYEYSFSFDTLGHFPELLFEDLAARFPELAFDCSCIEDMDECMGFGWFNAPLGGEEFRQDYAVPEDYWTSGTGCRRSHVAQVAHKARIDALLKAARRADGG